MPQIKKLGVSTNVGEHNIYDNRLNIHDRRLENYNFRLKLFRVLDQRELSSLMTELYSEINAFIFRQS